MHRLCPSALGRSAAESASTPARSIGARLACAGLVLLGSLGMPHGARAQTPPEPPGSASTSVSAPMSAPMSAPVSASAPASTPMTASLPVVRARPLPGDARRWDFLAVDPATGRLFATRDDQVDVLNPATGEPLGRVGGLPRVHGVVLLPRLGLGFASAGAGAFIRVFDSASLQTRTDLRVSGRNPDALMADPAQDRVWVFNHDSDSIDVIDANTLSIVQTIATSGHPEVGVTDGRGHVYVNIEDHPGIDVIDARSGRRVGTWPLADCEEPSGLDIDTAGGRLFSVCANGLAVVTALDDGRRVAQWPIGHGADGVAFDPVTRVVWSACGADGHLHAARQLDPDHYQPLEPLATAVGARTLVLDPASHRLYLPAAVEHRFTVLEVSPPR